MARLSKFFVLTIFIVVITFSCKSFGDPLIRVKGTVRDNQGKLLEGVTTTLENKKNGEIRKVDLDKITKADGNFEFTVIGAVPDNLRLTFKKEGFKVVEREIIPSGETIVDVVLESAAQ